MEHQPNSSSRHPNQGSTHGSFQPKSTGSDAKDRLGQDAERALREAKKESEGVLQSAKEEAKDKGVDLKQQVQQARRQASESTGRFASFVQEQGNKYIQGKKDKAAAEVATIKQAIFKAGEHLDEEDDTTLAGYVTSAAGAVESVESYLRDSELTDVYHDVSQVIRRHPAMALGGLFVAGLVASRFLKASDEKRSAGNRSGYPTPAPGSPYTAAGHDPYNRASAGVSGERGGYSATPFADRPLTNPSSPYATSTGAMPPQTLPMTDPVPPHRAGHADDKPEMVTGSTAANRTMPTGSPSI